MSGLSCRMLAVSTVTAIALALMSVNISAEPLRLGSGQVPTIALPSSAGRVIIGCRKTMAPGTYWTGLIDDVRIYNRAVNP